MKAREYEAKIQKLGWQELENLWDIILKEETQEAGWEAGKALEYLIVRCFELELGSEHVVYPYDVDFSSITQSYQAIEQIDGVVYANGLSFILECKDYSENLDVQVIAKLRNQLTRRPAGTIGCVFSTSGFTEPAILLAHFTAPQAILLWGVSDIDNSIKNRSFVTALEKKYRNFVEKGVPNKLIKFD
jgi:hypothetical protein